MQNNGRRECVLQGEPSVCKNFRTLVICEADDILKKETREGLDTGGDITFSLIVELTQGIDPMSLEREFTGSIEQCKGIIYKVIRLYINDPEDEQDLFQEILFQAWKSYPNFKRESKFSTWLYRVALNTVLTFKRRPQVVVNTEDLTSLNAVVHPADEAEELYQAVRGLHEVDRMIITLHLDGYENGEIADIAGLTANHVAVKLFRIKEALKKKLNPAVNGSV